MKFSLALIALVAATTYALPQGQSPQSSTWLSKSLSPTQGNGQGSPAPSATEHNTKQINTPAPSVSQENNQAAKNSPAPSAVEKQTGGQNQSPPQSSCTSSPTHGQGQEQTRPQFSPTSSPTQNQGQPVESPAPSATTVGFQNKQIADAVSASSPSPSSNALFSAPAADISSMLGLGPSTSCSWEFILTCANQACEAGSTCMTPMAQASTNCFSESSCASAIGDNAATCATCYTSIGKQQFIKACYEEQSNSAVAPIFEAMVSYGVCDDQGVETHA